MENLEAIGLKDVDIKTSVASSGAKYFSLKWRFRVLVSIVAATTLFGALFIFSQIISIRAEVTKFTLITHQAHLMHQLPHAVQMLINSDANEASLRHIKSQLLHDEALFETLSPRDRELIAMILKGFENPAANREILSANTDLFQFAHEKFDQLTETTSRSIRTKLGNIESEIITISLIVALLISGIPLYLVGRLTNRLSVLKRKVDAIQSNHDPAGIGLSQSDEIGEVGHALDQMYSIIETRRIEQMIKIQLMVEQEKMSAVANLAGGIAHEVGNPLASMMAEMQILENACEQMVDKNSSDASSDNENYADVFHSLRTSMSRLETLLVQVSGFPVDDEEEIDSVNLNELLSSICHMIGLDERTRQINFDQDLSPTLPFVRLSGRRFGLALYLIINSIIETLYDKRGDITICTGVSDLENHVQISIFGRPGDKKDFRPAIDDFEMEDEASNLIMARRLCSDYGGEVDFRIEERQSSYGFVIDMPVAYEIQSSQIGEGEEDISVSGVQV